MGRPAHPRLGTALGTGSAPVRFRRPDWSVSPGSGRARSNAWMNPLSRSSRNRVWHCQPATGGRLPRAADRLRARSPDTNETETETVEPVEPVEPDEPDEQVFAPSWPDPLIAKDSRSARASPDYAFHAFHACSPDPVSQRRGASGVPASRISQPAWEVGPTRPRTSPPRLQGGPSDPVVPHHWARCWARRTPLFDYAAGERPNLLPFSLRMASDLVNWPFGGNLSGAWGHVRACVAPRGQ